MKILVIKLSSLGDLIHVFPALSDVQKAMGDVRVDWMVEEVFAQVPAWHPLIRQVIPVGLRRLKQQGWWRLKTLKEIWAMLKKIRATHYDLIIDAQGLYKSALLACLARGKRVGLAKGSSRENVGWLYQQRFFISWELHAIKRVRELFAQALHYDYKEQHVDYQLGSWQGQDSKELVFVHATTWATKHYPQKYWHQLVRFACQNLWIVALPQVNTHEQREAQEIITGFEQHAVVLPKMDLTAMRDYLRKARGVVAVDTGLAHIAAAMNVPTLTLYGPTDPKEIGTQGQHQEHLHAIFECAPCWQVVCTHVDRMHEPHPPCFKTIPPILVWDRFSKLLDKTNKDKT
jgi:heptosyltransferase-1